MSAPLPTGTPTKEQIDALLDFLMEHQDLARGRLRRVDGRVRAQRMWSDLCNNLNAMGGCTKTVQQWQRVWTDKKYLAKKAAAAARRSVAATGGGRSTAPNLSPWELKILSIMGEGFGAPDTSARVPAFEEQSTLEATSSQTVQLEPLPSTSTAPMLSIPLSLEEPIIEHIQPLPPVETSQATGDQPQATRVAHSQSTSHTHQRRVRTAADGVRSRLYHYEEQRAVREEQRNDLLRRVGDEVGGLRLILGELCGLIQQLIDRLNK